MAGTYALLAGCQDGAGADEFVDDRGEIDVVIDGQPLDLSADRFQAKHADDHAFEFHLHEFDDQWYMEGYSRVTVAEGLDVLLEFDFEADEEGHTLTIDGRAYEGTEPGVDVTVSVNTETVDFADYYSGRRRDSRRGVGGGLVVDRGGLIVDQGGLVVD